MNVETITMDRETAREKLRAYRTRRHKDAEAEYAACAEAYEQLAEGKPLIDAHQAIRDAGTKEDGRPQLAIGRADRQEIAWWANNLRSDGWHFDSRAPVRRDSASDPDLIVHVPYAADGYDRAFARVPMVPADVRPARGKLKEWWILWEVEEWSDKPHCAPPPRDPLLLKHLSGPLYAVLAAWDLTEIERAVMRNTIGR